MKILRARYLGMCFGVRDAIAMAHQYAAARPLTILGELVHNETVLRDLQAQGVRLEANLDHVHTPEVMITAHGASNRLKAEVQRRGFGLVEGTCPLVQFAHQSLVALVQQGCHPVVIGKRGHVEVRGLTEDLAEFDIVLSEEEVAGLREYPRLGVAAQTTQPIERVRHLVDCIRLRFPRSEVRFVDTVCQPTKQRQTAAVELAKCCDVVVVIGGAKSNNTHELAASCLRHCQRVHQIQSAAELRKEWFRADDVVGITAGTSTPDRLIDEVDNTLRAWQAMAASASTPHLHEREHLH